MIDLHDFAVATLNAVKFKHAKPVAEVLEFDEEIVEALGKELIEDGKSIYISNICLYKYNSIGSNVETIQGIADYFKLNPVDLFCSYEINGGNFIDMIKPFKNIEVFVLGGVCFTKKALSTHPGGINMDSKHTTNTAKSKYNRILSNTAILGLSVYLEPI